MFLSSIIVITIIIYVVSLNVTKVNDLNKYDVAVRTLSNNFYKNIFYPKNTKIINKLAKDESQITFSLYDILLMSGYDDNSIRQTEFYKKCNVYNTMIRYKVYAPISEDSFILSYDLKCD